ncbi:MAG: 2-dehydro-3-deoxygalactonokinase [Sulfitobacter sp.]
MPHLEWIAAEETGNMLRLWLIGADGALLGERTAQTPQDMTLAGKITQALGGDLPAAPVTVLCSGSPLLDPRQCPAVPAPPPSGTLAQTAPQTGTLRISLLPGLHQPQPADLMQGPETRISGFLRQHPDFDGVICLPGAQSIWAHISAGEIVSFRSFLTPELRALLSRGPSLGFTQNAADWDAPAFTEAVAEAISNPQSLSAALFRLHAQARLQDLPASTAQARLAGHLIGLELAGSRPYWLGQRVALIADAQTRAQYAAALAPQGVIAEEFEGSQMALAGLRAAYETLPAAG